MQAVALEAGKPLRLFIALWPGQVLRRAIASWQQDWVWPPGAALVKPDQLHLTLHFLGDVPAGRLPELVDRLNVQAEPFALELARGEVWPGGIAVLRPKSVPASLRRLHAALARQLEDMALPVESRPYRAHVTLARRATGAAPPAHGAALPWPVDSGFVLVRSRPGADGYQVIARFGQ